MWGVHDDETLHHIRAFQGEVPGQHPAPVMPNQNTARVSWKYGGKKMFINDTHRANMHNANRG